MEKTVLTLTIEETMSLMRRYGMAINYKKLIAWTDNGVVPWAVSAPDATGRYQRTIFKRPLVEWLEAMAEED